MGGLMLLLLFTGDRLATSRERSRRRGLPNDDCDDGTAFRGRSATTDFLATNKPDFRLDSATTEVFPRQREKTVFFLPAIGWLLQKTNVPVIHHERHCGQQSLNLRWHGMQTTITMMERWFIITILHDEEFGEDDDMKTATIVLMLMLMLVMLVFFCGRECNRIPQTNIAKSDEKHRNNG